MRIFSTTLVTLLAVAFYGCGSSTENPAAGGSCPTEDRISCASATSGLFCEQGTWIPYACPGPAGCAQSDQGTWCDFRTADNVNPPACPHALEGFAVCGFGSEKLVCTNHKFEITPCPEPVDQTCHEATAAPDFKSAFCE